MRIGVTRTQVPFVHGGAERHAARLVQALQDYGHEATEITIPFKWYPVEQLFASIQAAKLTDLSEVEGAPIDLMIGLKFPAYLSQHPNMVFWILHQHRQAYDLWVSGHSELLQDPKGMAAKTLITHEDKAAFARSTRPIYANSCNVAGRIKAFLNLDATPLYHPPPLAEQLYTDGYDGPIFAPGRLNPSKRVDLMLCALAKTPGSVRLEIAGVADNPAYLEVLQSLARSLNVENRVTWLGNVSDLQLLAHYASARAVLFTPQDEDYGYITLEAMLAGKPVITVQDAGGPLEFITNNKEGHITDPSADSLALAMTTLSEDSALAERLGQAARARYAAMDIRWDHVVETLTGQAAVAAPDRAQLTTLVPPELAIEVTVDAAVAALRTAIAPPAAPELPFASIIELLDAYDFETLPRAKDASRLPPDSGLASYLGTHWTRYLTTLRYVTDLAPRDVLDVGVFPPLVFEAMMVNALNDVRVSGLWEGPHPYAQAIKSHDSAFPDFDIALRCANIERDVMPYEDGAFDMVLGMEIFEHLALDPYFFLSQAARVLRPGGHIVLTTPNLVSHRGVQKTLDGRNPYSFGLFVPTGGVYGRHNREYTAHEVEALGTSVGFDTHYLGTADVYDTYIDPATAALLQARGDDLRFRGENIIYVGRKARAPGPAPEGMYHGDPRAMSGALSQRTEATTGLVHVTAENKSSVIWPCQGSRAISLLTEWIDPQGVMVHTNTFLPLSEPVAPGAQTRLSLRTDVKEAGQGTLKLGLFQTGVGALTGTGRANTLTLPCSQAAFLKMVSNAKSS